MYLVCDSVPMLQEPTTKKCLKLAFDIRGQRGAIGIGLPFFEPAFPFAREHLKQQRLFWLAALILELAGVGCRGSHASVLTPNNTTTEVTPACWVQMVRERPLNVPTSEDLPHALRLARSLIHLLLTFADDVSRWPVRPIPTLLFGPRSSSSNKRCRGIVPPLAPARSRT